MDDLPTPIGVNQPRQHHRKRPPRAYSPGGPADRRAPRHYIAHGNGGIRVAGAALAGFSAGSSSATGDLTQGPATLTATGTFRPAIRPSGGEMMISERKRNAAGQPPGQTHHPEFLRTVVEAVIELRSLAEKAPSAEVIAGRLGVSRSSYFEWLGDNRLNSADIKIAASSRTILDGVERLVSIQQKRRQQRV